MGGIQKSNRMPVLISGNNQIISNKEKAEVRTEASVKVHSNISDDMKELREKRVRDNQKMLAQNRIIRRHYGCCFYIIWTQAGLGRS